MSPESKVGAVSIAAMVVIYGFIVVLSSNQPKESHMPRTKSTEVYEVTIPTAAKPVYVEAQGKQEARAIAIKGITVEKLSGREVRDLIAAGKTILDGSENGADDDTDPTTAGQQSLLVGDPE